MSNDTIDFGLLIGPRVPVRKFKAGETIFEEGDPATEVFVIQSGQVGIQTGDRRLDTLDANSIFGEMALIDPSPRSASAVAVTDVILVPITEKQFLYLVSQTPFFALNVMRALARRLRAANRAMGSERVSAPAAQWRL
jgi:CRP/FNR family transcriptional regulator, cyclic AMP receptor protein